MKVNNYFRITTKLIERNKREATRAVGNDGDLKVKTNPLSSGSLIRGDERRKEEAKTGISTDSLRAGSIEAAAITIGW